MDLIIYECFASIYTLINMYLECIVNMIHIYTTVGENIIATHKIRYNYDAIQSFKFPILR